MSLFLCIYTYMYTHTQIYHKHIYWEDEENISSRQERTSKGKNQEVYTETLHLFVFAAVPVTDFFPVLAEKSRINPEQHVRRKQCNFLGQLQERCKGWFLGGEWVEDGVWHTGGGTECWHRWHTLRGRKMGLCVPADAASVPGKNCTAVFRTQMCISQLLETGTPWV